MKKLEIACGKPTGAKVGEPEKGEPSVKGGEATPSGWQPGKPTLKPGPDLVGKVWEVWTPVLAF